MASREKLRSGEPVGDQDVSPQRRERAGALPWSNRKVRNGATTIVFGMLLLVLWQVIGSTNPLLMSYPTAVADQAMLLIADGTLGAAFAATLQPFILGYILAAVAGIPLGLIIGRYEIIEAAIGPYITAGYSTPLVALTPLFIVWFGIGFTVKVAIVFTLTIFPIIINTWRGVQGLPKTMTELGYAFGASQAKIMRKIIIPGTLPHIMTGLRLGVGRAVIAVVIAEFFTAVSGLGGIVINSANSFNTARMFVPIIAILIWGVLVTSLVGLAERKLAPWHVAMSGRE